MFLWHNASQQLIVIQRTEEQSSIINSMRVMPAVGHNRLRLAIDLSRSASSLSAIQFNRPALPKDKKQKGRFSSIAAELLSSYTAKQLGSNRLNPTLHPFHIVTTLSSFTFTRAVA